MADRTVKVTLQAQVSNYIAGMEQAAQKTRDTGTEAEKLAQKKEAFDLLGRTSMVMGAAIAAGVGLAIAKYAEFDQAMSNVQAATHASAEDQKLLADAAIAAGASSVFSATESANAIEELSKAGLDAADILGGALTGSLDLASAGELGVARAAEIASTTLQQFKLDGDQAGHVADVLAAGAGKAMGSVEDLANGLKFVGPVANSMNISLEETTGVLAMFAQQGIIGEQAGTSLRGVIASLTSPSSLARGEIERLGLQIYDANGKFLGLENAAGELSKAYGGMDDASRQASLGVIFGRETITAATALYQEGAAGVRKWTDEVDDSGYASETAAARLDNLKGDVEALGGAFDTALIQTGEGANDSLRFMAQALTNVIDLYNAAPEPVKIATLAVAGLTAAALLAGGAFLLGAPKVAQFNAALATMGPNAQKAGALLTSAAGPIGIAFAAAATAVAIFAGVQADAKAKTDAFAGTLDAQTGAITRSTREMVVANLAAKDSFLWFESDSTYDAAKKLGIELDTVTEAALGNADAMKAVNEALDVGALGSEGYDKALEKSGLTLSEFNLAQIAVEKGLSGNSDSLEEAIRVTDQKAAADEEAARSADENASSLEALTGTANDTNESIDDLAETIRGFGSAVLDQREAARQLEESYDSLAESIKENGTTLDTAEEKGRANEAALDGVARAALDASAATLEQTGSQVEANAVIATARTRLIEMLGQLGITGQEAEAYADKLGLIPDNVYTAAKITEVDTAEAILDNLARNRTAIIQAQIRQTGADPGQVKAAYGNNGFVIDSYADGGLRENHVAQIAPAGTWRVWAEDETGGEAYIPLAMSKRARSLDIWAETGRRLGVEGYANGGMYASSGSGSTAVSVNPQVSLAGATLNATIDGQPIRIMIQDQIAVADQSNARAIRRGRQG